METGSKRLKQKAASPTGRICGRDVKAEEKRDGALEQKEKEGVRAGMEYSAPETEDLSPEASAKRQAAAGPFHFNIEEELKKLPGRPGVYIMHDARDEIIYVGKAVSLKNRVRQYFQTSRNKGVKIEQMVQRIRRFEYIVTDSELEALVLECNLIKEHRPKYNTMLKDDKSYPFICVTVGEAYPRILFARTMKKDKSKYYGPFTSAGAVKDTIDLIKKLYHLRSCNKTLTEAQNPEVQNPEEQNPEMQNPEAQNPEEQNPGAQNQKVQNPEVRNPEARNPEAQNPEVQERKTAQKESSPLGTDNRKATGAKQAADRACLYYHLGQCKAPCQGCISREEYRRSVNEALDFLNGNYAPVLNALQRKMEAASETMEFEKAIEYRDLMASVRQVAQRQKITQGDGDDRDVLALAMDMDIEMSAEPYSHGGETALELSSHSDETASELSSHSGETASELSSHSGETAAAVHSHGGEPASAAEYGAAPAAGGDAVVQVFFIRGGKMIGRDHFYLRVAPDDTKETVLGSFVKQYYAGTPFVPREVMLETEIEDQELVERWLSEKRGQRVYLRVPKKGTKEKLIEMAAENAAIVLRQDRERIKREEGRTIGAVHELEQLIGLDRAMRMEAYDISNISGFESVGSMIVYEKGKPKRSDYRKFKIRTVQGPNDYASMEEVLTRRFSHGLREQKELAGKGLGPEMGSFSRFPDLILMDGGRGQVNVALRVLEQLKLSIPVCGMVKDDFHRTRGVYYNNVEIPIDTHSEAFHLVTRIQDEAHRFAIEYHRSLRGKGQVRSILDEIGGIGPTRRKALMRTFKTPEAIRDATLEELTNAPSMNARSAKQVYEFFHGADNRKALVTEDGGRK